MRSFTSLLTLTLALTACDGGAADDAGVDASTASPDASPDRPDAMTQLDAGADAGPATGVCEGVDCGPVGRCVEGAEASCECDPGYHADGLRCALDGCPGPECPRAVSEWETLWQAEWERRDREYCTELATSTGVDQEHYFLSYCIDGLTSMWRATGDDAYLDLVLGLIDSTLADAELGADGYRHWPGPATNGGESYPLWESYYWRHVVSLVRVLHDNPEVRARADYQARYEELLAFSRQHVWEKWRSRGEGNLYRSRTHMASHWARIGMELHVMTGEMEYLEVFENISFGEMPGRPSNLREQLYANPSTPSAYTWSSHWGVPEGEEVQDTSHAGAIVSFIVEATEHEMYWTADDHAALTSTLLDVMWQPDGSYARNVDGTGGHYPAPGGSCGACGRLHEWLVLGRRDRRVQARVEADYTDGNLRYFGTQALGIAALNARYLLDGGPVY